MPFLLERLAARRTTLDSRDEAFNESAAIQAQIQRVFASRNSHADGAAALLQWGLPNVVEMGHNDTTALARYADQARRSILQYEPRLKDVVVTVERQDDVLAPLRLMITATRADGGEACSFDVQLPR